MKVNKIKPAGVGLLFVQAKITCTSSPVIYCCAGNSSGNVFFLTVDFNMLTVTFQLQRQETAKKSERSLKT